MKNYLLRPSLLLVLAASVVLTVTASAQQVISPMPTAPVTPNALAPYQTAMPGVVADALGLSEANPPLQWGPVALRPRLDYSFLYGNGIESSPGTHVTTAVHEVSPGLTLAVGDHFTLDYSPIWTFYSSRLLTNTLDHSATLAWGSSYEDWVLGFSQGYQTSSGPLVETGGQTRQETYTTAATASYRFSQAMSVDLAVNQVLQYVQNFQDSKDWSTMDWLNYQFAPTLTGALGLGCGYVYLHPSPNQTYEQYQARLVWNVTGKVSVTVHGGLEDRQVPESLINPIFGATIQYQPFEATAFILDAERTVESSYFLGEVTETTSVTANITQRFLSRYYLTVGGGYSNDRYIDDGSLASPRTDDYYSFNARLSTSFLTRGTIAATYEYSNDVSTQKVYGYTSHQVGCEIGYRF